MSTVVVHFSAAPSLNEIVTLFGLARGGSGSVARSTDHVPRNRDLVAGAAVAADANKAAEHIEKRLGLMERSS